ncbi:MAG: energy transducer TonB [Bacteroidota bacterium]
MKNFLTLLFLATSIVGYSQRIDFSIQSPNGKPMPVSQLSASTQLSQLVTGYPASWIREYRSTRITVERSGSQLKADGKDERLSADQQALLKTATVGDKVMMRIEFRKENPVTSKLQDDVLEYVYTVVPEVPAGLPTVLFSQIPSTPSAIIANGRVSNEVISSSLRKYCMERLSGLPDYGDEFKAIASLSFLIDEKGGVSQIRVNGSSGNPRIDKQLIEALRTMPAWSPGTDKRGNRIRQEFVLQVSNSGC